MSASRVGSETAPASVRYARVGAVSLAYQTWGAGGPTIVAIPPMAQNIELTWERPEYRRLFRRLGSFASVLHFDKRGTGASDRTAQMPTMDERVEDLRAIMDDAGIARAHLLGVSEGGPVALQMAATYPDRVDGVALVSSGARMGGDVPAPELAARRAGMERLAERWGTDDSVTLELFAPTAAADPGYRAWEPRYERQSASPAAIRQLLVMMRAIDVRPLLGSITVPVVVLHRRHDPVLPVELAREVAQGICGARLVELEGHDHMAQVGDIDSWADHVEELVTGSSHRPRAASATRAGAGADVEVRTMGGFSVRVDGQDVAVSAWGSRRARQLCKRLAVAGRQPVPREELFDLLWPDEHDAVKLGARLSVLLSNIRRVLGGGVTADRGSIRLDLDALRVDLVEVADALAAGDDERAVEAYRGPVLPEDAYDDWATAAREHLASAVVGARRRLATAAAAGARDEDVVRHASEILEVDPYDERAHELLVRTLDRSGRAGDAARADARYRARMDELGVRPQRLLG